MKAQIKLALFGTVLHNPAQIVPGPRTLLRAPSLKFLFSSLCCFPLSVEFSTFALSVSGSPFHYKLSVGLDLSFRLSMNCSYIYNSASALVDTKRVSEILGLFFSDVIISIIYFLKELVKASFILNYRWRNWGTPRETRPLAITS